MQRVLVTTASVVACVVISILFVAAGPKGPTSQVGRYQLATGVDGRILVLDAATGDTWSKPHRGVWKGEGNPVAAIQLRDQPDGKRSTGVRLPDHLAEFTVRQRQEKGLPGAKGSLIVRLGDVTGGVVLVSLLTRDGAPIVDEKPMRQGDELRFASADKQYVLRLTVLENVLIGEDFVVFTVSPANIDREGQRGTSTGISEFDE